ncbi:MAG: hypothetical protein ACP59X_14305 [Solidesulfovibrio sp. DCME]|uniref:hypothetical protein n=1 Tax=Solidesulfovibrio sp. DCME TaxID=3447380 RepID=UPI003D121239
MRRVLFLTLAVVLWAIPSSGFCGDPVAMNVLGAINYSINSINNARIIDQNQQAINNQREYLQQQAEALRQQNELARQVLELRRQEIELQRQTQNPKSNELIQAEAAVRYIDNTCDPGGVTVLENSLKNLQPESTPNGGIAYSVNETWLVDNRDNKALTLSMMRVYEKCTSKKPRLIWVKFGRETVAYADPTKGIATILK